MNKITVLLITITCIAAGITHAYANESTVITMNLDDTAGITIEPSTWEIDGSTGSVSSTQMWLNNTGAVAVSVNISTNATTDSGDWSLALVAGHDAYYLRENNTGASWTNITATGYLFDANVAAQGQSGDSTSFDIEVGYPTSSSTADSQETRVTFTATVN